MTDTYINNVEKCVANLSDCGFIATLEKCFKSGEILKYFVRVYASGILEIELENPDIETLEALKKMGDLGYDLGQTEGH